MLQRIFNHCAVIAICLLISAAFLPTRVAHAGYDDPLAPTSNPAGAQRTPAFSQRAFAPSRLVAEMMEQVQQSTVHTYVATLSGAQPAIVGGRPYTFTTRATTSGEPVAKATQYVYEHLQSLGLAASYDDWTNASYTGRNVVGVITGTARPDELVLITAHLDSITRDGTGHAPGADDNASGSTAVLVAADIFSHYRFERTVVFVWFTGEEQQLLGSRHYAQTAREQGRNIVAVYNMDMLAWDQAGAPVVELHTRALDATGYTSDLSIVNTFTNVVTTYGLAGQLAPEHQALGMDRSDHASFWREGYPAVLAIEDFKGDFNPNLHKSTDRIDVLDLPYFTAFVQASVGTVAHLAGPVDGITSPMCQPFLTPMRLCRSPYWLFDPRNATNASISGPSRPNAGISVPDFTLAGSLSHTRR